MLECLLYLFEMFSWLEGVFMLFKCGFGFGLLIVCNIV